MAINIKTFLEGLRIFPKTSTSITAKGELEVIDSTGKIQYHNGTTVSPVITEAHAADITGKTLLEVDNLQLNGNTIASTNADGSVTIDPNGNGNIVLTAGGTGLVQLGSSSVDVDASGNVDIVGSLDVDNLNLNGNTIISTDTNGDIVLTPDGTGLLKTDNLALGTNTISSTNVDGNIILDPNGNGNIALTAGGTGLVQLGSSSVDVNASGSMNITGDLDVDNLNLNGNSLTSTNADGSITLDPNGNGNIVLTAGGTGLVQIGSSSIDADASGNMNITGSLSVDNIDVNANTISSTDANGDITLDPNGTGLVKVESAIRIPEAATPSTPASGYGNIYFKSDGFLYQQNDAGTETKVGAGTGGINYITNSDAESSLDGWTEYDDAAATPVDLTGGTAANVTRSSSSPLRGTNSFLFTAGTTGEGVAFTITPDRSDYGNVLEFSLDAEYTGATAAEGNYTVWVYDVANSVLIQPVGYKLPSAVVSSQFKFKCTFQLPTNATTLRVGIHQAAATSANLKFDNVSCGPQVKSYGPAITDWVAFTPTSTWVTNATHTGFWRRVGGDMELDLGITCTGAPTSASLVFNMPSGYTIDTSKISIAAGSPTVGYVEVRDVGVQAYAQGMVRVASSTTLEVFYDLAAGATSPVQAASITQAAPITFGNTDVVHARVRVPITGWSSGQLLSSDADTRVVAARYISTAAQAVDTTSGGKVFDFATSVYDTHGAVSGTGTGYNGTWKFTAPISGYYRVSSAVKFQSTTPADTATRGWYLYVSKNGTNAAMGSNDIFGTTTAGQGHPSVSTIIYCNAGDYIQVKAEQNVTATTSNSTATSGNQYIDIERISGPSQIAASETVAARYSTNTGGNVSTATYTYVDYEDKSFDTHGMVSGAGSGLVTTTNTGWRANVPISGKYRVTAETLSATGGGWAAGEEWYLGIAINGTVVKASSNFSQTTHSTRMAAQVSSTFNLVAGDRIEIVQYQSSGGTLAIFGDGSANTVSIERIGN